MRTPRPNSLAALMIVISLLSFAPLSSTVAQQNESGGDGLSTPDGYSEP